MDRASGSGAGGGAGGGAGAGAGGGEGSGASKRLAASKPDGKAKFKSAASGAVWNSDHAKPSFAVPPCFAFG